MLGLILKNTRQGAYTGNGYDGFCIATIQPPLSGFIVMEEWRDVNGFEGYYRVSNYGKVYSIRMKRIMSPWISTWGYECLSIQVDGNRENPTVHKLVALNFIGKIPKGYVVNHKDGIKTNNRVDNLEIISKSEDVLHALRIGLMNRDNVPKGENHNFAILTQKKANEIRILKPYYTQKELGKKYGVHESTISDIIHKRTWNYEKKIC